jgi:hypothetical protein
MSSRETHPADSHDRLTICAIAVVAACATAVAHEALGHGSACVAFGGRIHSADVGVFPLRTTKPVGNSTYPK